MYMKGKFSGGSIKGSIFTLIMATIGTGQGYFKEAY